jgi:hypothetical protein
MGKIVDVEMANGNPLIVERRGDGKYDVIVADVVRHPGCDAESVMHALGHYIHSMAHNCRKYHNVAVDAKP